MILSAPFLVWPTCMWNEYTSLRLDIALLNDDIVLTLRPNRSAISWSSVRHPTPAPRSATPYIRHRMRFSKWPDSEMDEKPIFMPR